MDWPSEKLTTSQDEKPLLIVWLLDETKGAADDRSELASVLHQLYSNLKPDTETAVVGFGAEPHKLTKEPIPNTKRGVVRIQSAFDRVPNDKSGEENLRKAVQFTIDEYSALARHNKQRLVVIAITDESPSDTGDTPADTNLLEGTIKRCLQSSIPIYGLGREAIFGKTWARIRWRDPRFQLNH